MKNVARVKLLSRLDMEPLLSVVLRGGALLSVALLVAGLLAGRADRPAVSEYEIRAISIPRLLQTDLSRFGSNDFWHHFLVDLGFVTLMITPYARLILTWFYLVLVKKRWRYAAFTGVVLLLLAIVMFSDVVLSPGISGILQWYPFKG